MPRLAALPTLMLAADGPRFLAIARALIAEIERGRWRPGEALPSSRQLAKTLEVHRNTVLAALAELEAQGWIESRPAKGVYVAGELPLARRPHGAGRGDFAAPGYRLPALPAGVREPPSGELARDARGRKAMTLSSATPDPRLLPLEALTRAWRRVVQGRGRALLGYGDWRGYPALRSALAEHLRVVRGVPVTAERLLITRGSQMALDLCARALLPRGARVAVEALGYHPAWAALRLAGAELVPIPVDGEGLQVEALARALRPRRGVAPLRALYLTPHHQYPTTVTLSPARRLALGALARAHRLLLIEDDYDHEFHYHSRPIAPLAAGDDAAHVVYVGTLSKVLAPGLRLGFVAAPQEVIERLGLVRAATDRQGDLATEAAVAELIEDGELSRHVRRMHVVYRARRDALAAALRQKLGDAVAFELPRGGISLWAHVAPRIDVPRWLARCADAGVLISPGSRYTFDGKDVRALRMVFAPWTPAELGRAVGVMEEALG